MSVEEARQVTVMQVARILREYIDRHARCSMVEERWLSNLLADVIPICDEVRTGGMSAETRAQIDRFRLTEIEKEKENERKNITDLEREAARIEARLRPPEAAA